MLKSHAVPLDDPHISPVMRSYIEMKGFKLREIAVPGAEPYLFVIGVENNDTFELGYELFCTISQKFYADELKRAEEKMLNEKWKGA